VVVSDSEAFPDGNHWMRVSANNQEEPHESKGCMCWGHKRQSYCGNKRAEGEWFCESHVANGYRGKMPCPLDPRHSAKPAKIASHVLFCQSKPGQAFIQPTGSPSDESTGPAVLPSEYVPLPPRMCTHSL
jgi:hypothetical protein